MEQAHCGKCAWEGELRRLRERLDGADETALRVQAMAIDMHVLMEQMQRAQADLSAILREIRAIRARPAAHLDAIRYALISSAVATLISLVAGAFS